MTDSASLRSTSVPASTVTLEAPAWPGRRADTHWVWDALPEVPAEATADGDAAGDESAPAEALTAGELMALGEPEAVADVLAAPEADAAGEPSAPAEADAIGDAAVVAAGLPLEIAKGDPDTPGVPAGAEQAANAKARAIGAISALFIAFLWAGVMPCAARVVHL